MEITLNTTLTEIFAADTIELPKDPNLYLQIVSVAHKLIAPIERQNTLEDLEYACSNPDNIRLRRWVQENPDKIPTLINNWLAYKTDDSMNWQALEHALDDLNAKDGDWS